MTDPVYKSLPDGVDQWTYPDGRVALEFPGHIQKWTNPDGTETWKYPDLSKGWATREIDGGGEYYPPAGWSIETTNPDGTKKFEYPDGTYGDESSDGIVTLWYPGGQKLVMSPDGTQRWTNPDGTEKVTYPDGTEAVTTNPDGTQKWPYPDGTEKVTPPDGRVAEVYDDGTQRWTHPDGTQRWTSPDGTEKVAWPDGTEKWTSGTSPEKWTYPDGTSRWVYPDGNERVQYPDGTEKVTPPDGTEKVTPPTEQQLVTGPPVGEDTQPPTETPPGDVVGEPPVTAPVGEGQPSPVGDEGGPPQDATGGTPTPGDGQGGTAGLLGDLGEPYEDPATGEWRNVAPEDLRQVGDSGEATGYDRTRPPAPDGFTRIPPDPDYIPPDTGGFIQMFPTIKDPVTGEVRAATPEETIANTYHYYKDNLGGEWRRDPTTGEWSLISDPWVVNVISDNPPDDPGPPKFARDDQGQPPPGDLSEPLPTDDLVNTDQPGPEADVPGGTEQPPKPEPVITGDGSDVSDFEFDEKASTFDPSMQGDVTLFPADLSDSDPSGPAMDFPPSQVRSVDTPVSPPGGKSLFSTEPPTDDGASEPGSTPVLDSDLLDPSAPGPTLDPALFDLTEPGPTLDPALFDLTEPGPTLDPALFDPLAPGPTLDPTLFDPTEPGATLDPAVLDPTEPGPTLDPNQLDPSAPGPTLEPSQLEAGLTEPSGVAQPAGVTDHGFTDPSLTEPPPPETGAPDQDADGITP